MGKIRFHEPKTAKETRPFVDHTYIAYKGYYPRVFLLDITAVPGEIENNTYAKFWGQIRCIMGDVQVVYIGVVLFSLAPTSSRQTKW